MTSYIKLFYDFLDKTSRLNYEEKGRLIEALIIYAKDGIETESMVGNESFLFPVFKTQIDRDKLAYAEISEKRRSAGSRGGKAKQANASNCKQEHEQDKKEEYEDEYDTSSSLMMENDEVTTMKTREYIRTYVSEIPRSAWDTVSGFILGGMHESVIQYAIDRACSHGCSKWCYIEKILTDWNNAGVKTLAQAKREVAKFEESKRAASEKKKIASIHNYQQHVYAEADFGPDFYYNSVESDYADNGR